MFTLIKTIIWIAGALAVAYFAMGFLGFEINKDYFSNTKKQCEKKLKDCTSNVIHQGVDNAECDFQCVDPKLIIKKQSS